MKKKLFCCLMIIMTLLMVACEKDEPKTEHDHTHDSAYTLRVALSASKGETHYEAVERFAQEVEAKSKGEIKVSILDSGKLGNEEKLLESISHEEDKIDIVLVDMSYLTKYDEKIDVCEMPFAFKDYEEAREFMNGKIQEEASQGLSKRNMRVLSNYANGFHYVITNKKVDTAADFSGVLIATSEGNMSEIAMKTLGVRTQNMSISDAISRLRQGNFDGYEGDLSTIYEQRMYQEQKYLIVTNHNFSASCFVISESVWSSLSQENQEMIREAAMNSAYSSYDRMKQQDAEILNKMESAGVKICHPKLTTFWEKAEPVIRRYSNTYGSLTDQLVMWKSGKQQQ